VHVLLALSLALVLLALLALGTRSGRNLSLAQLLPLVNDAIPGRVRIRDFSQLNYALKRLEERGLVLRTRKGKEVFFSISDKGRESCQRYRDVREECLIDACVSMGIDLRAVGALSGQLRALSGLYGQAARAAAVLYE
jgi:predicted MarR family transcription regulator